MTTSLFSAPAQWVIEWLSANLLEDDGQWVDTKTVLQGAEFFLGKWLLPRSRSLKPNRRGRKKSALLDGEISVAVSTINYGV